MRYQTLALLGVSLAMGGFVTSLGCDKPANQETSSETEAGDGHVHEHGEDEHADHGHEDGGHDHEGEDVHITAEDVQRPANYADALVRVAAYRDTISQACSDGKPSAAHRPLDELTFVLEWLPGIARDSGIDKSHWEIINVNAQTLSERFDELHVQIDAGGDVDYDAIAGDVDSAIEAVSNVPTAEAEPAGTDSQAGNDG